MPTKPPGSSGRPPSRPPTPRDAPRGAPNDGKRPGPPRNGPTRNTAPRTDGSARPEGPARAGFTPRGPDFRNATTRSAGPGRTAGPGRADAPARADFAPRGPDARNATIRSAGPGRTAGPGRADAPARAGFTTRDPSERSPAPANTGAPARTKPPARDRKATGPRPSRPPEREARVPRTLGQPAASAPAAMPPPEPSPTTLRAPAAAQPNPESSATRPGAYSTDTRSPDSRNSGPRDAPRGSVWLHGTHAVAAALANPARRLKRLLLTEDAEAALAEHTPQPWPLPAERVVRAKLDLLLGRDTVHQGAALLADLLTSPPLATVLERPGPVLVLDQVTDPRNVGALLRSAAAFGAAAVFMQDRNAPEETGVLAKAASGALEIVPLLRAVNLARTLAVLKAAGFWVVGLDAGGPPLRGGPLRERRVALVLGAEGAGLRRLTRETCDELAGLAMPGGMESLNVSAAATVALYELVRPE